MDRPAVSDSPQGSHPLLSFRRASHAVLTTQELDEVLKRVVAELYTALDAEAASIALLDKRSGEFILQGAGPVGDSVSELRLPPGRGIIGWVIANGKAATVNDVSNDERFWPDVDGYSGFTTRSALCAPLLSDSKVIGALEVLNKRDAGFSTDDLDFLEAFGAVAASAIENAQRFQREKQRRREAETLRKAWEALTTPRSLDEVLDFILIQLAELVEYRSAAILLVSDEGGLELGASRGIDNLDAATKLLNSLGLDIKVRTMLETLQPVHIADTRADSRWQHYPGFSYIRSWIGAPLLIKGHLIGTLNVDHDRPRYYTQHHVNLVANFAHQVAIAIENSRLYAVTHEATLQLAEQARRMVTLYETSRSLLSGLELERDALYELIGRIGELIGARYGFLDILAQDSQAPQSVLIGAGDTQITELDIAALEHSILDALSGENEVIRSNEVHGIAGPVSGPLSPLTDSFLAVAIHARGKLLGRLFYAGKHDSQSFSQDDVALALALAANLAGAIENATLYHKTQQRVREMTALYEISRTVTAMKDSSDVFTHLVTQVAKLLDAERCAFFIFRDGLLECQPPGYGLQSDILSQLRFPLKRDDPVYAFVHHPDPLISNEVMQDPDLVAYRPLLARLGIQRVLSCQIAIDENRIGLLLAADKRGGEEFSEQDRHLVSIMAHQVSSVLQRALLQDRQRQQTQIQSALLQVSQAISCLTDLDELLHTVAQITHQLVGCNHCLIASWDERHSAFVPRAESGLDAAGRDALAEMRLSPADIPFIDQATETRVSALLTRRELQNAIPAWTHRLLGTEYSLIVPLVIQDRVVGLIAAAYAQKSYPPGQREITLATGIARQAAIAIENSNLYHDLQLHAERLERAYRDLTELDERKTQFVQNVSHELRTPLTLIKGHLELLLDDEMGALSDRQKQGLAVVAEKIEALGELILDIVTIQSIDANALEWQVFDLRLLLETILASTKTEEHGAQLMSDLPSDLPYVKADPNMIERALFHLLDNAIKFSPEGGGITVRARPDAQMMRIEVADQGVGIPEEEIPHIFDLFYQVDGSTTRRFGGIGLGLSIVEQIVTAHGGRVDVHSGVGQGSTFYFTLPLAAV